MPRRARQALMLTVLLFGSVGSYWAITRYVVQTIRVKGSSMNPALLGGEERLLHRWVLWMRDPIDLDVVAFRDPLDGGLSVKRVIAEPGDEILLTNRAVWVNGKELLEPYVPGDSPTVVMRRGDDFFYVADDHYFMLGDNRTNSLDSRLYGAVWRKDILGIVYP